MRLKKRLFLQNIIVVTVTVIITIAAGFCYNRIYETNSAKGAFGDEERIAVIRGNEVLYKSENFSQNDLQSAMMELEMGRRNVVLNGRKYSIIQTIDERSDAFSIRLRASYDFTDYYKKFLVFVIGVFIVTYIAASIVLMYYNKKYITDPLIRLKRDTQKLIDGELDNVVSCSCDGEIFDLCEAVERLRVRLCESVYMKEKYDENRKFLISGISHDLRTPVTAIRGYIEGVLDGVVDTKENREKYLKAAILKTDDIKAMIDDLLLYSKLDLNQVPFDKKEVSIFRYMADFVRENEYTFNLAGKKLEFHGGIGEDVKVLIDCERFGRVISNLFDNAFKNIKDNIGITAVYLRETNTSVIIEIKDNGCGIKEEDLPNIFNRFYRGDSARKADGSSGLGLTIAKQIVEGMGGRIWAVSKEGEGASFLISLKKCGEVRSDEKNFDY